MFRSLLSTAKSVMLIAAMSFSILGDPVAASEVSSEGNPVTDELEVEIVDSQAMDDDLEIKQAGELSSNGTLAKSVMPDVSTLDIASMGEEVRSSRADGISAVSSEQSVTVSVTGTISEEGTVSYLPVTLAPGDILQATLEVPANPDLNYDLLLYMFDNNTLGEGIKSSSLSTYMNQYPDGSVKSVDEGIAYINTDSVNHTYAVIVFPAKGYSAEDSYKLTISLDEAGYYDASEPNESPFDVKTVTPNTYIEGHSLNVPNDQDWFAIDTTGLSTTGVKKMGFIVSESSYSVEVYYAVNTEMRLVNPVDGVYNITEGYYYIKVFNKNADFVSKDYTLKILGYGEIPAKLQIYYDFDMDGQKLNFREGLHYAFQYVLLPGVRVTDGFGNRVPNVNVKLEWIGDTAISPNNGQQTKIETTDLSGYVKFRMQVPRAHGIHIYTTIATHRYDYDTMIISCGTASDTTKLYHVVDR